MSGVIRSEDVKDACTVLEYLVHDLIAAHQLYDFFTDITKIAPVHPETEKAVRRMYVSTLFLSLNKFLEFYDRYSWLIPNSCKQKSREIRKELTRRNIKKLRNTFIGHVMNKETGRPISNAELDAAFNTAIDGDLIAFLKWVHVTGVALSPETIVGALQSIQSELVKTYGVT